MEYKRIRGAGFISMLMAAATMLGAVALTFGPWANPSSTTGRSLLVILSFLFSMIGTVAFSAANILEEQADQIDTLRRALAEQQSHT